LYWVDRFGPLVGRFGPPFGPFRPTSRVIVADRAATERSTSGSAARSVGPPCFIELSWRCSSHTWRRPSWAHTLWIHAPAGT
jgi:hypothetical protein